MKKSIRYLIPLLLLLLLPGPGHAQERIHLTNGCAYGNPPGTEEIYTNFYSTEVVDILNDILEALNLRNTTFELKSSNVNTAVASIIGGRKYILYSEDFIRRAEQSAQNKWVVYSILAHELGHHILDHDFSEKDPGKRKLMELEADEFSGSVLRSLCSKQEDAMAALNELSGAPIHPFYPPVSARIEFIANGWIRKDEAIRREGRDPCGQIIELAFGKNYKKLNHARNVKAMVKEEEMIITYDAISQPGKLFCRSFIATPRYSSLTPSTMEWKNDREKFGKDKEIIWYFAKDGYTRDQVMRPQELGIAVFDYSKVPRPIGFEGYVPGMLTVVAGGVALGYSFSLRQKALNDYDQYEAIRDPNDAFYQEANISRSQFYQDTDDKYITSQAIRNTSIAAIGAGLFWVTNKYLKHRKSRIGILHLGEDYIGICIGRRFVF
ncbi:MAG: hypothetical protein KDD06_15335 [Phaeodactylibacter sp.]|nr:hypothetical protein [Phaeodactylibacter sp.]MCB9290907.1 hypothetical protein [Lewinellaceae bacterium]